MAACIDGLPWKSCVGQPYLERLPKVRPEDLTENSVLIGRPNSTTETPKKVEAAGFAEVILYFNVGLSRTTK